MKQQLNRAGGMGEQKERERIESGNWWENDTFQNQLTALIVYQPLSEEMEQAVDLLHPNDLLPGGGMHSIDANSRWLAFELALDHYQKTRTPIGDGISVAVEKYGVSLSKEMRVRNAEYCAKLKSSLPTFPGDVLRHVVEFKKQRRIVAFVNDIADRLVATNCLGPDELWRDIRTEYEKTQAVFEPDDIGTDTPQWPEPLSDMAFQGLAGDVVRAIEPHTESDPAALLVQFLLVLGNVIDRHAYWQVESTRHYLNVFAVLVGATSKARKGTSLDRVLNLFEAIDSDWLLNRRMGGLSTGEGLISNVRDPVYKNNGELVDAGETDKRLLIVEPEFARVLRVGEREAATLPSILRDAWDRGELRTLTKNSPLHATGAHISMIGHITEDELRRTLSDSNRSNGFANRFLWLCVRRSKKLPYGGAALDSETRGALEARIAKAIMHAQKVRRMGFGTRAKELFRTEYDRLSEGATGILGATTDRAEAQVRRLACLYALLDCQRFVHEEHLRAALEVWRYCFDSARFLFGASAGDPVADKILKALRARGPGGMSRNEIRTEVFNQNKSSEAIGHALESLLTRGHVRSRSIPAEGAGRPTERWYVA